MDRELLVILGFGFAAGVLLAAASRARPKKINIVVRDEGPVEVPVDIRTAGLADMARRWTH